MADRSAAAMEEGVRNSKCVIAIISGATIEPNDPGGVKGAAMAYFARPFCVQVNRCVADLFIPVKAVVPSASGPVAASQTF